MWIDLLKAEEYRRYLQNPELLRAELAASESIRQIVIDEVQKVPQLLDEAHWLHENRGTHFALCGSSARKVKRGQANLLGGRAVRYELHGLTAGEIGREFNLDRLLNHGYLTSQDRKKGGSILSPEIRRRAKTLWCLEIRGKKRDILLFR